MNEEEEKQAEALLKKITDAVRKEQETLRKTIEDQGLELQRLKAGGKHFSTGSPLLDVVKSKQKDFENLLSGQARSVKIVIPHETMKTLASTASITGSTHSYRLAEVGQLATPPMTLRALFRSVELGENSGGIVRYLDQSDVTRGAATRAEGAEKPESEIEWTERTLPIRKIPDSIPVTKELLTDFTQLARDIEQFLMTNVALKVEDQLWDGDGNAPNLKGLYTSAVAYAGYSGPAIEAPNIYDLLTVLRATQIAARGGKYNMDFAVVHPSNFASLKLTKATTEEYLLPSLENAIAGMRIVESAQVTPGTLLLGDSRFATIYTIGGGVEIEIGYVNNQFRENKITILAEERLALLVRDVDADGFLKVTDIDGALTTLETPGGS